MRLLAITELMRMTRAELCDLLLQATAVLPRLPVNSPEYANSHANLRNIRMALSLKAFASRFPTLS